MIGVIDCGLGNVRSVLNMLGACGLEGVIVDTPSAAARCSDGLILPGVGAFDAGVSKLKESGFFTFLQDYSASGEGRLLGICLGMQLLFKGSEEGNMEGLGFVDGQIRRFDNSIVSRSFTIPNMGWRYLQVKSNVPPVFDEGEQRFYFVHAFHADNVPPENVLALSYHGYDFVAAVCQRNLVGVQFHPEKSHDFGKRFFMNWGRKCNVPV